MEFFFNHYETPSEILGDVLDKHAVTSGHSKNKKAAPNQQKLLSFSSNHDIIL